MLKVCSCCLRSRAKSVYSPENWESKKIRRCKECAASNKQILNPNIKGTLPLPSAEKGKRVFASKDLANDIIPDREGNLHLAIGDGGKDVRNTSCGLCGKEASENCKLQECARCKKIKYCSKECQVKDWKRHKREECIKKGGVKVEDMAKLVQDAGKMSVAYDIGNSPPDQAASTKKLALDFILRFYPHLAAFAAYHIEKYRPLKGALFIFSKVSFHDLMDVPRDSTTVTNSELDRMFAMSWGCRPVDGVTHRPRLSVLDLAGKFLKSAPSLDHYMDNCCDREMFPVVICCDPRGKTLPDVFDENLSLPKNVDPVCYMDETPSMTHVGPVKFFDFGAMLELAGESADCEAKCITIDRP